MKKIFFVLIILLNSFYFSNAQGPGEPFFPQIANGARNSLKTFKWRNPPNTTYNEFYLSYDSALVANLDSSVLRVSGFPNKAHDSIFLTQSLFSSTRYFWRVVEYSASGFSEGPIWYFYSYYSGIDDIIIEDFSFGLGNWTFTSSNNNCRWKIDEATNYNLPIPSSGKVLSVKNTCGGSITTTAYFNRLINLDFYGLAVEFDTDIQTFAANDNLSLQYSTNSGSTWNNLWQRVGVSDTTSHIQTNPIYLSGLLNLQFRFRATLYGNNSIWAIDNFKVLFFTGVLTHAHPYIDLQTHFSSTPKVSLYIGMSVGNIITLERKKGLPVDTVSYHWIATFGVPYSITYIDSTVQDSSIYSYRAKGCGYGNEVTAYVFKHDPVPVELINFSLERLNVGIILKWETKSELNNRGFEIERKSQFDNCWNSITFIQGYGTTTQSQNYSFTDGLFDVNATKISYRLKQIDFNGTFSYSKVIDVELSPSQFSLSPNYPNPFNPNTKISWQSPVGSWQTLKVYDILGDEVATLVDEFKPAGNYEVEFPNLLTGNVPYLPSGVYFYQLKVNEYIETKKMILIK